MSIKTTLFKALDRADETYVLTVFAGTRLHERVAHVYGDLDPGSLDECLLEFGDEDQLEFKNQEIEIDEGCARALDLGGVSQMLMFKMTRPVQASDFDDRAGG